MLAEFLLCGLVSLTLDLKSAQIEKCYVKEQLSTDEINSKDFFSKIVSNLNNKENSSLFGELTNASDGLKNVDVIVEVNTEVIDKNIFSNEEKNNQITTINETDIKHNNERIFNLFNLCDFSSYYLPENLPFLTFKYECVDDFYKSDFYKLEKYDSYIKNVFVEKQECGDCSNRNASSYKHPYDYKDALSDVGIPCKKSFDGTGINIGSIEPGIPENYINLSNTYYEINGTSKNSHCFQTSSVYGGDYGIASGANLFLCSYTSNGCNLSKCIDWLIDCDVNVVNMSMYHGFGTYNSDCALLDYVTKTHKICFIKSAGNEGPYGSNYPSGLSSPGLGLNTICVAATSYNKKVSYFSSAGVSPSFNSLFYKPTLAAPGDQIYGVPNISKELSGTSIAAPFVTGITALLMQEFPDLKNHPEQVMSILTSSCEQISGQNSFDDYDAGFGLVNYENARKAYLNTYAFEIGEDENPNSVLFSKDISIPSGESIYASASVLYNSDGIFKTVEELPYSKIKLRIKGLENSDSLNGLSKSNLSNIQYTNHSSNTENITLQVLMNSNKNSLLIEDCAVSYRIIPAPNKLTEYFEEQIIVNKSERWESWFSFDTDGYRIFQLFGNCTNKVIELFGKENNLLESDDTTKGCNTSSFMCFYVQANEKYKIRVRNESTSNSGSQMKLSIVPVGRYIENFNELHEGIVENFGDNITSGECYSLASNAWTYRFTAPEKGFYRFGSYFVAPEIFNIYVIDPTSNKPIENNVDVSYGNYKNYEGNLIKLLDKGKTYFVVLSSNHIASSNSIWPSLRITSAGEKLFTVEESGGNVNYFRFSGKNSKEDAFGVFIPSKSSYVTIDTTGNNQIHDELDVQVYNLDEYPSEYTATNIYGEYIQEVSVYKTENKHTKVYFLSKGVKYAVKITKKGNISQNVNAKVYISYQLPNIVENIEVQSYKHEYNDSDRYLERTASLLPGQKVEYFFRFETAGIKLFQTFGNKDTYMQLYDSNWNLRASDDDSGFNNNALIRQRLEANTTYRLVVSLLNANDSGYIKTSVTPLYSGSWEDSYNDMTNFIVDTSKTIRFTYRNNCSCIGTITVRTSGYYTFETSQVDSYIDTFLYVIDPNDSSTIIENKDWNNDYRNLTSRITRELKANVKYFLVCTSYHISNESGLVNLEIRRTS